MGTVGRDVSLDTAQLPMGSCALGLRVPGKWNLTHIGKTGEPGWASPLSLRT